MKKILFFCFAIFASQFLNAQQEEIFKIVEDMPQFPGCEEIADKEERAKCAQTKLVEYIGKNLKYPTEARDNKVEGTVVISFVVNKNGDIEMAKIVRSIGAGCEEEALRVVNSMNNMPKKWIPGKQRGKLVNVMYTLPFKFKLSSDADIKPSSTEMPDDKFIRYFEGTVLIDGEIKGTNDLKALNADQIESVKVYKGEAGKKKFDLKHNYGVISVVTKK